jgi:asparagine synthase (glutamine-hydrolysing)
MCGINGLVKKETSQQYLIDKVMKMNFQTSYRGPDNSDIYHSNNTCLGHNRLSIIDLTSRANQPFKFNNLHLVFNGEIYNYKKIRNELINLGYVFKTNSDTEVVILAFDYWRVKCFDKFEGMFAIALLDSKSNHLYVARDFFGEKPLYYNLNEGKEFIFSSEINPVRDLVKSFSHTKLDKKIIPHYLKYLYLPSDKSPYENIYSLKKGHYIKINLKSIKLEEYNSYVEKKENLEPVSLETLKENLITSVGNQLQADVDVGLWLSGGIDSSLIAAIARKEFNIKLNTFTVKFSKELSYNNEYKVAENVAKIFDHSITHLNVDYNIDNPVVDLEDVTRVNCTSSEITNIGKVIRDYNAFDTGIFIHVRYT